jgi:hypothetical protein
LRTSIFSSSCTDTVPAGTAFGFLLRAMVQILTTR